MKIWPYRNSGLIVLLSAVAVSGVGANYFEGTHSKNDVVINNRGPVWYIEKFYERELPNTHQLEFPPQITGNHATDARIRMIAEKRGYRLQRDVLDRSNLKSMEAGLLQEAAFKSWLDLKSAADQAGIKLGAFSSFRSINDQKWIFLNRFRGLSLKWYGRYFTDREIADGKADAVIDAVLKHSSIPGYSKHHSGYTLDLIDRNFGLNRMDFGDTDAYRWLSANNFFNARRFGFVPSYPEGVANMGPEPETWEFIWVGDAF